MKTLVYTIRTAQLSSTELLIGKASIGSDESDLVWKILKVMDDGFGNSSVLHSNGSTSYNCSWTNRLSYTYL